MAGYKYFVILTDIGKQKLAEAIANETALDFTEMAVGDSNGTSYEPTSDMTALKHETYRATISNVSIDEIDKNIMIFQLVVPSSSGGYYIREAGLFSSDGSLIAIARTAEQYKPQLSEGAGASIDINMRIAISSEAQIYINVPESINYATQTYVAEEFKKHKAEKNPHTQYVILNAYNEKIDELEQALSSKADSNHNHDSVYLKKTDASSTYATKSELNTGLSGKAANNHSHAFSAITGSMDITDSRLTGNLPVARVTGAATAPTYYTTSAGEWVETKLNDGKILLQGWGTVIESKDVHTIKLPKKVSTGCVVLSPFYYAVSYIYGTQIGIDISSSSFTIMYSDPAGVGTLYIAICWYVTAILA